MDTDNTLSAISNDDLNNEVTRRRRIAEHARGELIPCKIVVHASIPTTDANTGATIEWSRLIEIVDDAGTVWNSWTIAPTESLTIRGIYSGVEVSQT